jgi:diaminohydroxyphosphoribosylaminopyrimidine deaminase/5-amino-6-(5-phosphoribosylamino)uracil reductase
LPHQSRLARSAREVPVLLVTTGPPVPTLIDAGVRVVQVAGGPDGRPDLEAAVAALRAVGLDSLLVEGGGQVAASFLRAGLIDRIEWFRGPLVLGAEGRPAVGPLALRALEDAPRFDRIAARALGEDLWERYERR